jgi:DNA-binding beta-propeller fold protein YncE
VIKTSTNSIVATVNVGNGPTSVAVAPNGDYLYVVNAGDETVSVVSI